MKLFVSLLHHYFSLLVALSKPSPKPFIDLSKSKGGGGGAMHKMRFKGFRSLEAYREKSKTNTKGQVNGLSRKNLQADNQWKQIVSAKIYCFFSLLSSQALSQSASTWTIRILRMVT